MSDIFYLIRLTLLLNIQKYLQIKKQERGRSQADLALKYVPASVQGRNVLWETTKELRTEKTLKTDWMQDS